MASPLIQQCPSMPLIKRENADLMVSGTDGEVSTRKVEFGRKDKIGSTMVELLESIAAMRSHIMGKVSFGHIYSALEDTLGADSVRRDLASSQCPHPTSSEPAFQKRRNFWLEIQPAHTFDTLTLVSSASRFIGWFSCGHSTDPSIFTGKRLWRSAFTSQ